MLIYNVLSRFFNAFESFVTKITLLTLTNITISGITRNIAVLSTIASKLRFAIKI